MAWSSVEKYEEKENLIGKPICPEFSETLIEDTSYVQLNFRELLKKYEGNVVYLDIWSLRCGPCIGEMPLARELEKRLKDYPIEFVATSVWKINDKEQSLSNGGTCVGKFKNA